MSESSAREQLIYIKIPVNYENESNTIQYDIFTILVMVFKCIVKDKRTTDTDYATEMTIKCESMKNSE